MKTMRLETSKLNNTDTVIEVDNSTAFKDFSITQSNGGKNVRNVSFGLSDDELKINNIILNNLEKELLIAFLTQKL